MNKRFTRGAAAVALLLSAGAWAQEGLSSNVVAQMNAIRAVKASFTPAQKKLGSTLAFGMLAATNDSRVSSFSNALNPLPVTDKTAASAATSAPLPASTKINVTIYGTPSSSLANAIKGAGGTVVSQHPRWNATNAVLPISAVLTIAGRSDVTKIRAPSSARTNVGALTSQGYVTHEAYKAVASGYTGAGVTVGVLSDSAYPARIAALKASGDLPASASVLPGQDGPDDGSGEDEGAAMMEIVHDMAPGANIIFATAFNSEQSFADNIIALAAAGCKVIVDDISYFDEPAFQDGIVQQAINQVTAAGVIYFSSAANSGNLTKGTSGTWEGDFKDGGPDNLIEGPPSRVHNFAATGTQTYDVLTSGTNYINLFWSDPQGNSTNDYDLFVLNADATSLIGASFETQNGPGSDPYEIAVGNFPAGSRVVVVKYTGVARALHVDTERGMLSIATAGATFGHNAGDKTVSMAATYWNSAKTGAKPFTGFPNINESFSSDGPRKIFYNPNGTTITPGNVLFATGGGRTLQKPDLAAADGVSTKTPGFLPFFGTSAAAPHAAGIAALIRSARPDYTVDQVKTAMRMTALDSMAFGPDRDSGYGIAMAKAAVDYAVSH